MRARMVVKISTRERRLAACAGEKFLALRTSFGVFISNYDWATGTTIDYELLEEWS
jgi:hypothetical protein